MRYPTIVVRGDILASWLTISGYNKSQLAMELDISKGRVSQLLTSREEPSAHLIAKLMTLTHLPFERLFKMVRLQSNGRPTSRSRSARSSGVNGSGHSGKAGKKAAAKKQLAGVA